MKNNKLAPESISRIVVTDARGQGVQYFSHPAFYVEMEGNNHARKEL